MVYFDQGLIALFAATSTAWTCDKLSLFDAGSTYRDSYDRCATFPNDAALEHGSDVALSDLPNPDVTP